MRKNWFLWLLVGLIILSLIESLRTNKLTPKLAIVRIEGTITDSKVYTETIDQFAKNPTVRGLLIEINSPGGGIVPTDEIYKSIQRFKESKKPVVAYLSSVAASGGLYAACAADYIVAHPLTLTGSIGTIIEYPVVKKLMDKIGVEMVVLKSGQVKDIASPFKELTKEERAILQNIIEQGYNNFVKIVSEARNIPVDSVLKFADGRVFTGQEAYKLGLVDTLGDIKTARDKLIKMAKLKEPVSFIEKRKLPWFLRYLDPEGVKFNPLEIKFDYRMVLP